jgi:hypothetical protein
MAGARQRLRGVAHEAAELLADLHGVGYPGKSVTERAARLSVDGPQATFHALDERLHHVELALEEGAPRFAQALLCASDRVIPKPSLDRLFQAEGPSPSTGGGLPGDAGLNETGLSGTDVEGLCARVHALQARCYDALQRQCQDDLDRGLRGWLLVDSVAAADPRHADHGEPDLARAA